MVAPLLSNTTKVVSGLLSKLAPMVAVPLPSFTLTLLSVTVVISLSSTTSVCVVLRVSSTSKPPPVAEPIAKIMGSEPCR